MQRKLLTRTIVILIFVALSIWQLYPTFNLQKLTSEEKALFARLSTVSTLSVPEMKEALINGELESVVRSKMPRSSPDDIKKAIDLTEQLAKLDEKITKTEPNAIKRGLDLQGGAYLVYEVNFLDFANNIAKNKDSEFQKIIAEADNQAKVQNQDFFDVLQKKFTEKNIPVNRYFGKPKQTDEKIIEDLKKQGEDAISRSLEVLRNRIDQFGVSEPTIQKEGSKRIIVALAGIDDVNRAKRIIGKTALLEFKLVRDWADAYAVVQQIDKIVKQRKYGITDTTASTAKDSTSAKQKVRDDKEINLNELFGEKDKAASKDSSKKDTTVSVDKGMFDEHPFISLFGNVRNLMAAPKQNINAINRILNYPEVQAVIPKDSEFLWSSKPEESVKEKGKEYFYLLMVKKEAELTGNMIERAAAQSAGESSKSMNAGGAIVEMSFNSEGAKVFSRVTGANIGKSLAIVLDDKISSFPRIKDKIPFGNAQIDGMANLDEAKDLVVVLKAGSLPAKLESIEEQTVGPSLGQDSLDKAKLSTLLSVIAVFGFMVIYYGFSGLIADFAVVLNIGFLFAMLATFHFTLTLPGVAGILLTIGMAVDANVLIHERIREELRSGKTIRTSIDTGYSRAFLTILDSNLTTLIAGLVLYQFGTGSIKGFAVTLSIGIVVSMYTSIVVTRVIFDFITSRWNIKKLSV